MRIIISILILAFTLMSCVLAEKIITNVTEKRTELETRIIIIRENEHGEFDYIDEGIDHEDLSQIGEES